jgi:hypothetical protein
MKTLFEELKRRLAQGFFPDNFLEVGRLAEEASWQTDAPLGLYVLSRILLSLSQDWPKQGVETPVADEMQRMMEPPISAYLEAASRGLTAQREAQHLNAIITSYLRWRSAHD